MVVARPYRVDDWDSERAWLEVVRCDSEGDASWLDTGTVIWLVEAVALGVIPWVDVAPCDAVILAVNSCEAVDETLPPGVIAWESVAAWLGVGVAVAVARLLMVDDWDSEGAWLEVGDCEGDTS